MRNFALVFFVALIPLSSIAQSSPVNQEEIKEDLDKIISDLSLYYTYLDTKGVDLDCIRDTYSKKIGDIQNEEETVLFFEYLLDEFYDSHLILNTNRKSSYKLYSPIYAQISNGKYIITNLWQSQIHLLEENIIGAEILQINGIGIDEAIEKFPTQCHDKNDLVVKEWITNKLLAGRYNQPRILTLRLKDGKTIEFDIDDIKIRLSDGLLSQGKVNDIGIIRINNSLGNNNLIREFDKALDTLGNTKALIIDLRNTVDGGNSYVARGIMGRFIDKAMPYQVHKKNEMYDGNTIVERSWTEYVSPRGEHYEKPVIILVGRWTGSMGEGLAIGFDGIKRGIVIGTEMERLAGEMYSFSFRNQSFGYRLSVAELFHIDGTAREKYIPPIYVSQTTNMRDETMLRAINQIADLND